MIGNNTLKPGDLVMIIHFPLFPYLIGACCQIDDLSSNCSHNMAINPGPMQSKAFFTPFHCPCVIASGGGLERHGILRLHGKQSWVRKISPDEGQFTIADNRRINILESIKRDNGTLTHKVRYRFNPDLEPIKTLSGS
jgi:hypothetical protein